MQILIESKTNYINRYVIIYPLSRHPIQTTHITLEIFNCPVSVDIFQAFCIIEV